HSRCRSKAMINRRAFLKEVAGAGGLLFVGCGLASAAGQSTQSARPKHPPVMLRGRRIKTVDVHAHCAVPKAQDLLSPQGNRQPPLLLDGGPLAERLKEMDAQGIDLAVLSINPNWYGANRDIAAQVITVQNEALAEFCASHSDRFAAFASVALQFPDLAAEQLEQGMKKLALRGAA